MSKNIITNNNFLTEIGSKHRKHSSLENEQQSTNMLSENWVREKSNVVCKENKKEHYAGIDM